MTAPLKSRAERIKKRAPHDAAHWDDRDALSAIARLLRVRRVEVQELCRFASSWKSVHEAREPVWTQFHIVTKGRCRLELPDGRRLTLEAGSLLLIPHGGAHCLRSARGSGAQKAPIRIEHGGMIPLKTNTAGAGETELICGRLEFEEGCGGLTACALPQVIVSNVQSEQSLGHMRTLVRLIAEDLKLAGPGALAVASHLSSALFVLMMRVYFKKSAASSTLLRLLNSSACVRAVNALVNHPARPWTLDELAEVSHVSRATLVRAFRKAAGMAPLRFLTELRLDLARQSLSGANASLSRISSAAGYASASAFARAFSRRFGVSPGKLRGQ